MRLSKKRAIELSIELWTWLAKTGKDKDKWPRWKEFGAVENECFLCEYDYQARRFREEEDCCRCPYFAKFGVCDALGTPYEGWDHAHSNKVGKLHAAAFLKQLEELVKP